MPWALGAVWLAVGAWIWLGSGEVQGIMFFIVAAAALGWTCGMMGSILLVRRMALLGDALAHAVLPGVVTATVLSGTRSPQVIFIGAIVAGLAGVWVVELIQKTTRLKSDAALGIVLAVFYAIGLAIKSAFQANSLNSYIFGQIALISRIDFQAILILSWVVSGLLLMFHRPLMVASFDPGFSRSIGLPMRWLSAGLLTLLALVVVVSLQAVGVVLVSALLITPAAAAYLLSDRMARVTLIAGGLGAGSGIVGCLISSRGENLASGPVMVLTASAVFFACFALSPRHGFMTRAVRYWGQRSRIRRENTLKAIYRLLEDRDFEGPAVGIRELAQRRRQTLEECRKSIDEILRQGMASFDRSSEAVLLTPSGFRRGLEIVRNHRLWELYLSQQADYAPDHVHDDAEAIEHILGEEVVRSLERQLSFPKVDPHGKPIPGISEIHALEGAAAELGSRGEARR